MTQVRALAFDRVPALVHVGFDTDGATDPCDSPQEGIENTNWGMN